MDEPEFRDLIDQAFAALGAEDYVRAVGIADQLAAAAPDRAVVRAIRAQALLGTDAPEESFQEARRAVELDRHDGYAQRLLAMTAWRTGRLALAQESFRTAIDLSTPGRKGDRSNLPRPTFGQCPPAGCFAQIGPVPFSPHRAAVLSQYAWFLATERGPKPAQQAAQAAIAADAESSTAWAALGLAQFRLHRRDQAEASLRRALQLNPNDLYAQSAVVTLLQDQHDDAKAEALAGLIGQHAGTEELVAAVRDNAKQRQIARMLVERKVDLKELVDEPRSYRWIWLLAGAAVVTMFAYLVSPWLAIVVMVITLFLLVAMRRWLE
jgi:Tfp pilus assembly protein PilF